MAREKKGFIKGSVGPVSFKEVHGIQYIASKPGTGNVKQSKATKKAGITFGMASKLQSQIKECYTNNLMDLAGHDMHSRLTAKLNNALIGSQHPITMAFHFEKESFSGLKGFEYNEGVLLDKQMQIKPDISIDNGIMRVAFPSWELPYKLKHVKGSTYSIMTFSTVFFSLQDGFRSRNPEMQTVRLDLDTDDALNGRVFTFKAPEGCLCIVSVFLQYFNQYRMLNNETMSPGAICDAIYVKGDYQGDKDHSWIKMNLKF